MKIHLWLSVPFGIIITVICFSGAMLVFEPEITRSLRRDVYYVASVESRPVDLGELMESVKATLPDSVSITGVTVFNDRERTYQVNLSKPHRAALFVDQYSGEITGRYERMAFFSIMFRLHRWLLDSASPRGDGMKVGKLVVGISTLIFVIALVTGVIIWWPRAKKNLVNSLSISFKDGWKSFWRGLHVAGGMYALVVLLAMSLTGLTWSFDWYRNAFYAVCGVEYTPRNSGAQKNVERRRGEAGGAGHIRTIEGNRGKDRKPSGFGCWQRIHDELKAQNPDAVEITVGDGTASVVSGKLGNVRASDRYGFNRDTGDIAPVMEYSAAAPADRLRGWIYSVHTGGFGGVPARILWLLIALFGASLPLTGYYIWIKHLIKVRR